MYYVNGGAGDLGFRYVLEIPAVREKVEPDTPGA
jgi:hypothetical protein